MAKNALSKQELYGILMQSDSDKNGEEIDKENSDSHDSDVLENVIKLKNNNL